MKRNNSVLNHMLEDINDIKEFTEDVDFEMFVSKSMVRKAVCMSLINIGELTKALSADFKAKNSQIPWKDISGLRDIVAHKYHTINLDIVWTVVKKDIPALELFIRTSCKS